MAVPNIFGTATAAIPLSQLDQNFATAITIGNTAVYLGNTTTSLGNVTLTNVTISSGTSNITTNVATVTGILPEANGGTGTTTGYYGFKNRIINGAMVIDQRNAGASVTVNGAGTFYLVDRFQAQGQSADGVFTVQQSTTAPTGFANSILATVTTADSSIGSTQYYFVTQKIEGFNTADLGFGTANASNVTLSFWVRSSVTGTFGGSLSNDDVTRSYPFTYTISSANTWEQKSVTIAGDTSGTWLTNNGIGIRVYWNIGAGSSYTATANAWASQWAFNATGGTNLIATNGATFYITGVQFEKGSTATSFDYRPYGTELALCQRYFEKSYLDGTAVGTFSAGDTNSVRFDPAVTSQNAMVGINFAARKRASPTMTAYDAAFNAGKTSYFVASWNNNGVTGAWNPYQSGATINLTGVTGAFAFSFAWIASSEL
jgi:hypothetical protein